MKQRVKGLLGDAYPNLKPFGWGQACEGLFDASQLQIQEKRSNSGCLALGLLWQGSLFNEATLKKTLQISQDAKTGEVLVAAWERWGSECFRYFVSEITFVVWLPNSNELFAARDAMGIYNLYYKRTADHLVISDKASLVAKAFSQHPRLSRQGLMMWVLNAYDESVTLYEHVKALKSAQALKVKPGEEQRWVYWDLADVKTLTYADSESCVEHLTSLLETCVQDRCREGGVAVMLSGGLDSSSVAAMAATQDPELLALTYQFKTLVACDEWPKATVLMKALEREHRPLDAEANWLLRGRIPVPWQEDPFQSWDELTIGSMDLLRQLGKTTLLTGHGGDNLFTGFSKPLLAGMALPSWSWGRWQQWFAAVGETKFSWPRGFYRYLVRPKYQALRDSFQPWPAAFPWVPKRKCRELFPQGFPWLPSPTAGLAPGKQAMVWMVRENAMGIRRAIHWYHRMGKPYGIKVRHPLFDQRLAEFVVAIPPEKIRLGKKPKALFSRAMEHYLPHQIAHENDKPTLAAYYFQGIHREQDKLREMFKNLALADLGLLRGEALKQAFETYLAGDPNVGLAWFLPALLTEMWIHSALGQGFSL